MSCRAAPSTGEDPEPAELQGQPDFRRRRTRPVGSVAQNPEAAKASERAMAVEDRRRGEREPQRSALAAPPPDEREAGERLALAD